MQCTTSALFAWNVHRNPTVCSLVGQRKPATERDVVNTRPLLRSLVTIAATAGLAGCVTQDPFGLPRLDSPSAQRGPSTTLYYGYGPYARYGYNPYAPYGYGYGYHPYGYYPYYYGSRHFGSDYYAERPYPWPGYAPYPGGTYCQDANRDGRCDVLVNRAPPQRPRDQQQLEGDIFERLRDRIEARNGASPTAPVLPRPNSEPRRPPPPIKVAPPKASPPPAPRPATEPVARPERPAKRRPGVVQTEEP
jgi:hypothetical protein